MTLEDMFVMAKTVWGEARGEGLRGKIAVANVIINRTERGGWWGKTVEQVCRKPYQFSCFNENDPNRAKMDSLAVDDPIYLECIGVAAMVASHRRQRLRTDFTDFPPLVYHYMTRRQYETAPPKWAKGRAQDFSIGAHLFFSGVE